MATGVIRAVASLSNRPHICDCVASTRHSSPTPQSTSTSFPLAATFASVNDVQTIDIRCQHNTQFHATLCAGSNSKLLSPSCTHASSPTAASTRAINIPSTAVEFVDAQGEHLDEWELLHVSPVHCAKAKPTNTNQSASALGPLRAKLSPIFGRGCHNRADRIFSLRTASPHYGRNSSSVGQRADAAEKLPIDLDAEEAINMPSTQRNTNMDINRNNGYLRNGTIMTSTSEKREHLYKILVIGELGTGKTSFIKRYVHQFFSQNYRATIGVDFALKVLHWDTNTIVRLQLWDIAGQERFGNMTRVYYKEAVGAFIVFDVTRSGTFDCVSKWKEDLDSKVQLPDGSPIPCILLANKCDQDKQGIVSTPEKMDEYVQENGFAGWFETSAKENINIDEAARALVHKILLNDKLISAADLGDNDKFNLNNTGDSTAAEMKSKCAC